MTWRKEGNQLIEYDAKGIRTGRTYDFRANEGTSKSGPVGSDKGDGFVVNNSTGGFWGFGIGAKGNRRFIGSYHGTEEQLARALEMFLSTGKKPTQTELGATAKEYENVMKDVQSFIKYHGIDEEEYSKQVATQNAEITEAPPELNPYADYMEQRRVQMQGAEKGLLDAQTNAARQNADILAQQTMQQQAMFRDELIEQIKSDRLAKMRAGISPMQIAQENLQYTVGNMQANNQQIQLANQQKLAATQQQAMNPYQAYINSQAAVTGGQGYGAVATGFAATDAGDLNMQALRYLQNNPGSTYQQAMAAVKGN